MAVHFYCFVPYFSSSFLVFIQYIELTLDITPTANFTFWRIAFFFSTRRHKVERENQVKRILFCNIIGVMFNECRAFLQMHSNGIINIYIVRKSWLRIILHGSFFQYVVSACITQFLPSFISLCEIENITAIWILYFAWPYMYCLWYSVKQHSSTLLASHSGLFVCINMIRW